MKNSDNTYSIYEHKAFRVNPTPDNNTASISATEYFIDADPGFGNGTALSISGDVIDETISASTLPSLADGIHYLYIRTLNDDGEWSLYERQQFEISGTLSVEGEVLKSIAIYPNPVETKLHIKLPQQVIVKSILIYDLQGKLVYKQTKTC